MEEEAGMVVELDPWSAMRIAARLPTATGIRPALGPDVLHVPPCSPGRNGVS